MVFLMGYFFYYEKALVLCLFAEYVSRISINYEGLYETTRI